MTAKMMAVGYAASLPITDERSLFEFETPVPQPGDRDLLVRVQAVSVNPVDVKVRMRKQGTEAAPRDPGLGCGGRRRGGGRRAAAVQAGRRGLLRRQHQSPRHATRAFHLVDERIVGRKPKSLSFAEAAALPLTTLTAWELLFDRIGVQARRRGGSPLAPRRRRRGRGRLDRHPARAQAHRPLPSSPPPRARETQDWVHEPGAHHVIDHSKPFAPQLKARRRSRTSISSWRSTGTPAMPAQITEVIAPQGRIGVIDGIDALKAFDTAQLWSKCVSLHPELMFTRSTYGTPDMIEQHRLLNETADLVDRGVLRTTMTSNLGRLSAATLKRAHAQLESGTTIGKVVLEVA